MNHNIDNKNQVENRHNETRYTETRENKSSDAPLNVTDLKKKSVPELMKMAHALGIEETSGFLKQDIVLSIMKKMDGTSISTGLVEILSEGFGFMRSAEINYAASPSDIYISPGQLRRMGLRAGDEIIGEVRPPRKDERYFALSKVLNLNGLKIEDRQHHIHFDNLTPIYPQERLIMEAANGPISMRALDIIAPLGKGQRALIVAPPRTGKTVLMQEIAHSISQNHPEVELMVLLIDERPEEVTDMIRSVKGEVISSTFDEPATRHIQIAELVVEKARRRVEMKRDVVILLDSITRLARAYNAVIPSSGKVLTGGVDSNALQRPKRLFGSARNIEHGGSLTIIGTALVETGSRMDEVIFEEFKGTGNSEIVLDRKLSDKRVFPSIDINKSGTRKEELLIDRGVLNRIWVLRRILSSMGPVDAMEFLRDKLMMTKTNQDFFDSMNS